MEKITVVKIGGNVIDNEQALKRFIHDFAALPGAKVLIHGGGKLATRLSDTLGIETKMAGGRRITDKETLNVVTMVYAGLINKQIVAGLQAAGCNALGLSGADGNVVTARRRSPDPIDFGYVGDIVRVDTQLLAQLLEAGIVPVLCPIMHDKVGHLLNCNADSVASAVAVAIAGIAPTDLVYCFEKPGVLRDTEDESSLIGTITRESYEALKEAGIVSKGMLPKVENALNAVADGVRSVTIKHSDDLQHETGTVIK